MSKNGLFLVSLVAAVPGAVLVYLMVMSFLQYAGNSSTWPKALAGMALLVGLLLTLMPVGILVFGGRKAEKAPVKEPSAGSASEFEDSETIISESHEGSDSSPGLLSGATDPNLEVVEGEPDEFAMTGEIVTSDLDGSSEDFDLGSDFEAGGAEEEAVEVIDAEDKFDEHAPKKKKKQQR